MMQKFVWWFFVLLFLGFFLWQGCRKNSEPQNQLELRGADMSFLPEVRQSSIRTYNLAHQPEDMLLTLKKVGANTVRLRLWKQPTEPTSALTTVKQLAQEVRSLGMKVLLCVHYSDTWADPNNQHKPAQWKNLDFSQLQDSIYQYTKLIVKEIQPEYIQIGNEINNGFLWSEGHSYHRNQMLALLQKAILAVRQTHPKTQIMLHFAGIQNATAFFEGMKTIDYDWAAISYYPLWHGKDLKAVAQTLKEIARTTNKKVCIVETSYPFTLGWNDWTNNVVGEPNQLLPEIAATPEGQQKFLEKIAQIVKETPNGSGFCYWGAEWISYKGNQATNGSSWENQALWDFQGKALPALQVFGKY
ncbi:MAG: arabinogalactan endo-1,4-beta-galactosidase [Microscillaceae bacterium]|nr:arabinogalactan endo-1,4-beta-galactosidase [Microscillaceae bacterium]MDW8460384.1 glycosyl hydrolase 53 family protein [Cytophagales bacterium]